MFSILFKGKLRKIHIVSNNICYGPEPKPNDEIEQHLTINAEGRVWFSAYIYGGGFRNHKKSRTKSFKIEKTMAKKVLDAFEKYFTGEYEEEFATDIGSWNMELTNTIGKSYSYQGSLCNHFEVDGVDLSDLIREALDMDDLYVFDGNYKPDKVDRITVDYHRVTKLEQIKPFSKKLECLIEDYTEKLVVDRESESIEYIRNIGTDCKISHKFEVKGGVKKILDDLDVDYLFDNIEGNPPDVIDNTNETKDYTITVDFNKSPQCIIKGTYDKNGLPDDWEEFVENIFEFMHFYGLGEIFNLSIYNKVK